MMSTFKSPPLSFAAMNAVVGCWTFMFVILLMCDAAFAWHDKGVRSLAIDPAAPDTMYAATSAGSADTLFQSGNGAASWSATSLIKPHLVVVAIDPLAPTTLYAATDAGVFKTTDGGVSWSSTGLSQSISVLAVDPRVPTTIYAARGWDASGAGWDGVFKSTDGGATWSAVGPPLSWASSLAVDATATATLYAGSAYGVLRSTDGGMTWAGAASSWPSGAIMALAIDPATPTTVYAGANSIYCEGCGEDGWATITPGGVFKSLDGGVTWNAIGLSDIHTFWALAINPLNTTTIYAGTDLGLFKSTDGGATWLPTALTSSNVRAVAIDPLSPNTVYAGTESGVFKSTDDGGTWRDTGLIFIEQPPIISLSLDPWHVIGGTPSTGTVTLGRAAPAGGTTVTLSSDTPAVATVPATVTVPAGATTANFTISTNPINWAVRISGTVDGVTASANLMVYKNTLSSFSLSPTSVRGGTSSIGTVGLSAAAPAGGVTIMLSTDNPAVTTVPASVTVPAGATWANFTVSTSSVPAVTTVTISADNYWAALTVLPGPKVSSVTLTPMRLTGGAAASGTVTLTGSAPAGGVVVTVSSSNPAAAAVPASVIVPAGASSANFTVSTSPVSVATAVTISATGGGATASAELTVTPATISSVTLNPASVRGGKESTGTVALNGPAPAGGVIVTLSSSDAIVASVPGSVSIPAGATTARFTVSTQRVGSSTTVTISASLDGVIKSAVLIVTRR
jgi:photosystem II stability/assembly factor-like uncharacterized protein